MSPLWAAWFLPHLMLVKTQVLSFILCPHSLDDPIQSSSVNLAFHSSDSCISTLAQTVALSQLDLLPTELSRGQLSGTKLLISSSSQRVQVPSSRQGRTFHSLTLHIHPLSILSSNIIPLFHFHCCSSTEVLSSFTCTLTIAPGRSHLFLIPTPLI